MRQQYKDSYDDSCDLNSVKDLPPRCACARDIVNMIQKIKDEFKSQTIDWASQYVTDNQFYDDDYKCPNNEIEKMRRIVRDNLKDVLKKMKIDLDGCSGGYTIKVDERPWLPNANSTVHATEDVLLPSHTDIESLYNQAESHSAQLNPILKERSNKKPSQRKRPVSKIAKPLPIVNDAEHEDAIQEVQPQAKRRRSNEEIAQQQDVAPVSQYQSPYQLGDDMPENFENVQAPQQSDIEQPSEVYCQINFGGMNMQHLHQSSTLNMQNQPPAMLENFRYSVPAPMPQYADSMYQAAAQMYQPAAQMYQSAAQMYQSAAQMYQPAAQMYQPAAQMYQPAAQMYQPAAQMYQPAAQMYQPAAQNQYQFTYSIPANFGNGQYAPQQWPNQQQGASFFPGNM